MDQSVLPTVTVIMPIRNEADFIAQSLLSVLGQEYPPELVNVLIVDGMSSDNTRSVINQIHNQHPTRNISVLDNPQKIVPTGFNAALKHAKGDIIVRVDGHCTLAPDYIQRCIDDLRTTGADNAGGLQRAIGKTLVARAIALATSSPFGVGGARFHYTNKAGWADTVYLGAYPRAVFERIGGFDEELVRNQDDEFNFRLTQSGGKIWLDPEIRSEYYSRANLGKLWQQYYQYGFYKVRVIQKRGALPSWRHLVPALFVTSLLISIFVALGSGQWLWLLPVGGSYLLLNLLASIWTARRYWSTLPFLPVAFVILHFAYGIGFLHGLWYWRQYGIPLLTRRLAKV